MAKGAIVIAVNHPNSTTGETAGNVEALGVPTLLTTLGDTTSRLHATDTGETGSGFNALIGAAAPATRIIDLMAVHFEL